MKNIIEEALIKQRQEFVKDLKGMEVEDTSGLNQGHTQNAVNTGYNYANHKWRKQRDNLIRKWEV